jgi:hypothetical protein
LWEIIPSRSILQEIVKEVFRTKNGMYQKHGSPEGMSIITEVVTTGKNFL